MNRVHMNCARLVTQLIILPEEKKSFAMKIQGDFSPPYKLHIGCGHHRLSGWVNMDLFATPATDVLWNVMNPLPFADESCQYIFHEHLLEHFSREEGKSVLKECHRLLSREGVLRIAMPGLDEILENCADEKWRTVFTEHMGIAKTRSEYINTLFRAWGHQWIYDFDELSASLREAGFDHICKVKWGESDNENLRHLEHRGRDSSTLICEASKQQLT